MNSLMASKNFKKITIEGKMADDSVSVNEIVKDHTSNNSSKRKTNDHNESDLKRRKFNNINSKTTANNGFSSIFDDSEDDENLTIDDPPAIKEEIIESSQPDTIKDSVDKEKQEEKDLELECIAEGLTTVQLAHVNNAQTSFDFIKAMLARLTVNQHVSFVLDLK